MNFNRFDTSLFRLNSVARILLCCAIFSLFSSAALSQVQPPDREYLFLRDKLKKVEDKKRKKELAQKRAQAASSKLTKENKLPFDITATTIDFDTSGSVLSAAGNVIISYSTLIAEASTAKVNTITNEAELRNDVRISDINANLTADSAKVNLSTGESKLEEASLYFAEGNYNVVAREVGRSAKDEYSLKDAVMTTCSCPEGEDCRPWSIRSSEATVERDGYGQAWNSSLRVYDVPVFYLPYLIFPAKTERQSGLLSPTFGVGRRSGFIFNLPFYWDIDDSTDMTLTGMYESRVRVGGSVDARKVFSRNHNLEFGGLYLDESARDGLLLGTRIDGMADTTIDKNRFGLYMNQQWEKEVLGQKFQWLVDGHYVSDDYIPREIQNSRIGQESARFLTSSASLRTPVGDDFTFEVYSEFNQSLYDQDDDRIFQRLPQVSLTGMNFIKPFGDNPYGLRLVFSHSAESVNFRRIDDYSGMRNEINEQATLPFYLGNYLEGNVKTGIRATQYSLTADDINNLNTGGDTSTFSPLPDSSNRFVPTISSRVGTVFERVYDLEQGNPLKWIGELGAIGKSQSMERVKHTFEPNLSYLFVPDIDQSDNPQFDAQDQLAQRNVVTYSLTQRLFSRYKPRNNYLYGVEETAPRVRDLGGLTSTSPANQQTQFGVDPYNVLTYTPENRGNVEELVTFQLSQSYNLLSENLNAESNEQSEVTDRFSDIGASLAFYPNEYVRVRTQANFDEERTRFSSYLIENQLGNKRGDLIRSRLRFVEDANTQFENGIEFGLTDRLRFGYYSRWDNINKLFLEQRGGIRVMSACNCWMVDFLVADQINPDNTRMSVNVTLLGLGQIGNTFFNNVSNQNSSSLPAIGQ